MKKILCALLLGAIGLVLNAGAQVPAPPVYVSAPLGPGGTFPLFNNGTFAIPTDANYTPTFPNNSCISCTVTSSVPLTATRSVIMPSGWYVLNVCNYTTGGQSIQIIGPTGTGAPIANGACLWVRWDGTNYVNAGSSYPPAGVPKSLGTGWDTSYQVGTAANNLVQLNSSAALPAVSGANLTNLNGANLQSSTVANGALANDGITVNGASWTLGGTYTVAASLGGTLSSGNVSNLPPDSSVASIAGLDGSHNIDIEFTTTPGPGLARVYTLTFTASRGHNTYCVISAGDATTAQAMSAAGQVTVNNLGATGYEIYWNNESGITGLFDFILNVSCP